MALGRLPVGAGFFCNKPEETRFASQPVVVGIKEKKPAQRAHSRWSAARNCPLPPPNTDIVPDSFRSGSSLWSVACPQRGAGGIRRRPAWAFWPVTIQPGPLPFGPLPPPPPPSSPRPARALGRTLEPPFGGARRPLVASWGIAPLRVTPPTGRGAPLPTWVFPQLLSANVS